MGAWKTISVYPCLFKIKNARPVDSALCDLKRQKAGLERKVGIKMNSQEDRIARILADGDIDNEELLEKSSETVIKYLHYLKNNLEFPCIVTGIEDFPWEEKYVFGPGNKKEYEKLKKKNPSYSDNFEILNFYESKVYDEQIMVTVRRLNDKKEFILALDTLESIDGKSRNYQLLDDFSVWHVNY